MSTIATSVFHAELDACFLACQELNFCRNLLNELSLFPGLPTPIYCDNTTVIDFATRDALTDRSRLLDHKYHLVRSLVKDNVVVPSYVPTAENGADLLTKPLNRPQLVLLRQRIGLTTPS
jgi:hypothetical protein